MESNQTLHDFVLNLITNQEARLAFELDPQGALQAAGLGDLTVADVQDVVPLVADLVPLQTVTNMVPLGGDLDVVGTLTSDPTAVIGQLQGIVQQLPVVSQVAGADVNAVALGAFTVAPAALGITSTGNGADVSLAAPGVTAALSTETDLSGTLDPGVGAPGDAHILPVNDGLLGGGVVGGLVGDGLGGGMLGNGLVGGLLGGGGDGLVGGLVGGDGLVGGLLGGDGLVGGLVGGDGLVGGLVGGDGLVGGLLGGGGGDGLVGGLLGGEGVLGGTLGTVGGLTGGLTGGLSGSFSTTGTSGSADLGGSVNATLDGGGVGNVTGDLGGTVSGSLGTVGNVVGGILGGGSSSSSDHDGGLLGGLL